MRPTPADPDAWNDYLAEGNATQARKRAARAAPHREPRFVGPQGGWRVPSAAAAVRREAAPLGPNFCYPTAQWTLSCV
ncbi:hypothetical protein SAMN05216259_110145 [Actinacidiphila guanduensis]|uniref:Uncharacterized protein n=1 Tax=Actinacidiphila guanduensis TaxID=310781 RepID=A0A1H0K7B5_9ACTN|nr:hypothetical protein SAMN05216259_110145 [Actinacidiphila guanduensis]